MFENDLVSDNWVWCNNQKCWKKYFSAVDRSICEFETVEVNLTRIDKNAVKMCMNLSDGTVTLVIKSENRQALLRRIRNIGGVIMNINGYRFRFEKKQINPLRNKG